MGITELIDVAPVVAIHAGRAKEIGLHVGGAVALAEGYGCHQCGSHAAAATYTGTSAGVTSVSATCAVCGALFVIHSLRIRPPFVRERHLHTLDTPAPYTTKAETKGGGARS